MKNIVDYARARYTAKHYDTSKRISAEDMKKVKELLLLAPSSVNSQPWHFIIASTPEGKARIAKSTIGTYDFNKGKVLDSCHTVLFCARERLDAAYLSHITEKEDKDGRFPNAEQKAAGDSGRKYFVGLHEKRGDVPAWTANQTYLNIGAFVLGVAALGLDATAIEGFEHEVLNKEFGLKEKSLNPLCLVSIGYRAAHDGNADRPKSRLTEAELITEI